MKQLLYHLKTYPFHKISASSDMISRENKPFEVDKNIDLHIF